MPPPDRRATDTARSYAALVAYFSMGDGRSLPKLADRYRSSTESVPTKHVQTLKRWSMDGDWQARVAAADDADRADEEQTRAAIRAQRRAELEDRDWIEGSALRDRALELLAEMPRFLRHTESEVRQNGELVKVITLALKAGPGELARALKLASELQRLSVGEPTEQTSQTIEIRYVDSAIESEAPARRATDDPAGGETL